MLEQIRAMLLEEYSVSQWVLLFFLYSFCGWCWEVFLYLVKERRFVNRGFLFGPILPIYGFGAVGILLTCVPVEGNMALVALVYQVLGVCGVVPRVAQDQVTTVISMIINILCLLGIVVDPTTAGVGDSARALSYEKPRKEG